MDVQLYKFEVIKGKEDIAEEWLKFLSDHKEAGLKTLEKERVYFERYFVEKTDDTMYIYIFMMSEDAKYGQEVYINSTDEVDVKTKDYVNSCINVDNMKAINADLFFDNISSIV